MDEKDISTVDEFLDLNLECNFAKADMYSDLFRKTEKYKTTRKQVEENLERIEAHLPQELKWLLDNSFFEMSVLVSTTGAYYFKLGFIKSMHFMVEALKEGKEIKQLEVKGL